MFLLRARAKIITRSVKKVMSSPAAIATPDSNMSLGVLIYMGDNKFVQNGLILFFCLSYWALLVDFWT